MKNKNDLKLKSHEITALDELKKNILKIYRGARVIIFGSKARNDYEEYSDIDLLILIDVEVTRLIKEDIIKIAYEIELAFNVVFSIIIENKNYWETPLAVAMPLHQNIDREGVLF